MAGKERTNFNSNRVPDRSRKPESTFTNLGSTSRNSKNMMAGGTYSFFYQISTMKSFMHGTRITQPTLIFSPNSNVFTSFFLQYCLLVRLHIYSMTTQRSDILIVPPFNIHGLGEPSDMSPEQQRACRVASCHISDHNKQ